MVGNREDMRIPQNQILKKNEVSINNKIAETKFSIVKLQEISNNLKELLE